MSSISETLSDAGSSTAITIRKNDSFTYSATLSGDFDGKLFLRSTNNAGLSYSTQRISASVALTTVEKVPEDTTYNFICEYGDGESSLTGTADITLADVVTILKEIKDDTGKVLMTFKEDGAYFPLKVDVSGNQVTSDGVGALNGSTVSVSELGDGAVHKTVLTLASTPLAVTSVTTGAGVGGVKIYDFPAGYIRVLGCTASLALAVETQGDFTDGTPEGDVGIGSVAPANADALGTDATDDDYGTSTAFTMDTYAASVSIPPEAAGNFDGTSTAKDVYVNAFVDAADIDDGVTTNLLLTGTVTLTWINLGDY